MYGQSNGFRLSLAFLAGILSAGSSFPEIHLPWLAWLAPGLILWVTHGASGKSVFRAGFVAGLGHCLVSFYWLLLIPFPWFGVAGWLALSAWLALYLAAWCGVCWYLLPRRKLPEKFGEQPSNFTAIWLALSPGQRAAWPLLCAVAWVAMEMALGRILTGFPFITLGVPQFRLLPLIQIASLTGVYGVSFLVAWFSIALMGAVVAWRGGQKPFPSASLQLAPPLLVIGCVTLFGLNKLSAPEDVSARLKIALVQPSIPERVIWDPREQTNRFLKLMELSRAALAAKPDLLVWPEAALPEILGRNHYTQETIGDLVRPAQVSMVMGIIDIRPQPGAPGKFEAFNSAFLIDPQGELAGHYDKTHLVVFGEYLPGWLRHFPFLARLRRAADLGRGERPTAFQLKKPPAKFPVSICFEDCFPDEIRRRVDPDTDFILNLTNDGWFGDSATQWQHAATALFRAVENGIPLVRCTNNGLTCWVDARGRLHDIHFPGSQNIYAAGWKIADVPLRSNHHPTFYTRHGDWFGWACVGIVIIAMSLRAFNSSYRALRSLR